MNQPYPRIHISWNTGETGNRPHFYMCARRLIVSDVQLALPDPVVVPRFPGSFPSPEAADPEGPSELIYDGPGIFAGRRQWIRCESRPSGFVITAEKRSRFFVAANGTRIIRLSAPGSDIDEQVLLGPVLVLSMALQGCFTLHTSAVNVDGACVCFLGESGAGKSTAANFMEQLENDIRHVSDDMALFEGKGGLNLIEGMPEADCRSRRRASPESSSVPVRSMVWLVPAKAGSAAAGIRELGRGEITRRLIASSVGTRLFGPQTMQKHFHFCSQAGSGVSGYESNLPRTRASLDVLAELLRSTDPVRLKAG